MNTPNKLTVLRMVLVPVFVVFLLMQNIPFGALLALVTFAAAAITDSLDGHLARKNNQITTFGKFLDPLADKLLVVSALICFIELELASSVAVLIIIAREFLVTSVRLVASGEGKVIAANIWGKLKTVSQMVVIIVVLALRAFADFGFLPALTAYTGIISSVGIWVVAAVTVMSGITYLVDNIQYINTTK